MNIRATIAILTLAVAAWATVTGAVIAWNHWGPTDAPTVEATIPVEASTSTAAIKIKQPEPGDHPNFAWMLAGCMGKWAEHCDSVAVALSGMSDLQLCVKWANDSHCLEVEATP